MPFCRRFDHDIYPQIADSYVKTGKLKYFHRDMPLPFHQRAMPAARAAQCASGRASSGKCMTACRETRPH
jgi:protein-disulfide isomerase